MIKIHGPIGSYKDNNGVQVTGLELVDVIAQVEAEPSNLLVFDVNSQGGLVSVGYAIRDYMTELRKQGRVVNTYGNGVVGSIATVIFLNGTEREIVKGTDFVIHNPYATVQGDADVLRAHAKELATAEAGMAKYYSSVTGVSAIAMDLLMKEDKPMSTERAVQLKFATKEVDGTLNIEFKNMAIIAAIKTPEMKINPTNSPTQLLAMVTAMYNKLTGNAKNLAVTTDDGKSLDVEGDTISVGALVTINGTPTPAATYKLVDGSSFTTDAEGKITAITEADMVEAKMGDVVKDKSGEIISNGETVLANGTEVKTNEKGEIIEMKAGKPVADSALEKENADLKAKLAAMEQVQTETTATVEKMALLIGSDYKPDKRVTHFASSSQASSAGAVDGETSGDEIRKKREERAADAAKA